MQLNFADHFFQALGFALLNSFWQVALLWLLFVVYNFKKSKAPQNNFIFLIIIQAIGFIWFLQTFITAYQQNFTIELFFKSTLVSSSVYDTIFLIIGFAYLLSVIFAVFNFIKSYHSIGLLKRKNVQDVTQEWNNFLQKVCTSLRITNKIAIKVSTNIATPLTIGVIKPIILLPLAAVNSLTPVQLEAIIIHELAHIKRNDYFINLFLLLIDAFMFFNPFTKAIKKQILLEREHCCDDIVLQHQYSARIYSEALLQIASLRLQQRKLAFVVNAVSTKKELLTRVQRILSYEAPTKNVFNFSKFFLITLTIACLTFFATSFKKEISNNITKSNTDLKIVKSNSGILKDTKQSIEKDIAVNSIEKSLNKKTKNNSHSLSDVKSDLIKTLDYFKPDDESKNHFIHSINEDEFEESIKLPQPENPPVVIAPAIEKYPIITTQKFFIPATSSKPASVIVITTSENEKGKKTVQIEIVKGSSAIE